MENNLEKLKYPIGRFVLADDYTLVEIEDFIDTIRQFPKLLRQEVENLNSEALATPYRPDGWTIKQVIHHCADSHMNALLRFKWTLTEENPTIKPYNEAAFAKLGDYELPIDFSLNMIDGIHQHWIFLLHGMSPEDYNRTYFHPEQQKSFDLKLTLATYSWHCKHLFMHIQKALA
ncbi:MAG: putative metal-dependent hydrolase [Bacteroidetes bacterium]|nr:putative metal-dependent hydrolase [Bacteroidota bacterium]MBU1760469.1 putative metal-dependent hydrolase [Bacteroidota bacterium]